MMSRSRVSPVLVVALALGASLMARAAPVTASARAFPDEAALEGFARFIEARMAEEPSAGMSVALWLDGRVWAKGFGYRDLSKRLPATSDTSYRMASVTKCFTAIAAMQLWERGKLDLDADVRKYVPYFPRKSHVVTTRQLLGHLSGIPHYKNCARECYLQTHHDTRQSLAIFERFPLEHAPGAAYTYSSYGYNLAGAAIEGASGLSYGEYLKRHVFGPAGMARSRMDDPRALIEERAIGYRVHKGKVLPSDFVDISSRFAGGGTRSTVKDMVAFAEAYIDGRLVKRETMEVIERSLVTDDGMLTDYGMGFAVIPQSGRFVLAHGGGQPETSTLLVVYPAERFAVAIAANVEGYHQVLHDVKEHLVAHVLGDGGARRTPIGVDEESNVVARAASGLMSHGVAWFTRWGRGASESPAELVEAFGRLHALLDVDAIRADPIAALEAARLGDDPKGGRAYLIAGAHMAGVIAHRRGGEALRRYQNDEPFRFLLDYDEACRASSCPLPFRLSPRVVALARVLDEGWQRANASSVRRLRVSPAGDLESVQRLLRTAFADAPVRPDLSSELLKTAALLDEAKEPTRARAYYELALDLFPQSPRAVLSNVELALLDGDVAEATALLTRWARVEDDPPQERGKVLAGLAKKLRKRQPAAALELLGIGGALVPPSAELHDELASVAQHLGQTQRAIDALRAAEQISPSRRRAKRLQKLLKAREP